MCTTGDENICIFTIFKEFMISILSSFVGMSSQLILRDAKLMVLFAFIIVLETAGKF
jgi:hypothetical protein